MYDKKLTSTILYPCNLMKKDWITKLVVAQKNELTVFSGEKYL